MALVLLMGFFNKFYRLSISGLGLHVMFVYVTGCIKHAVHAEDSRTDIIYYPRPNRVIALCLLLMLNVHISFAKSHQQGLYHRNVNMV